MRCATLVFGLSEILRTRLKKGIILQKPRTNLHVIESLTKKMPSFICDVTLVNFARATDFACMPTYFLIINKRIIT